jgi:hypothetical protein
LRSPYARVPAEACTVTNCACSHACVVLLAAARHAIGCPGPIHAARSRCSCRSVRPRLRLGSVLLFNAGATGTAGTNGKAGTDGKPGADGKAGPAGKDGKPGADGKAGPAGKDGALLWSHALRFASVSLFAYL